MVSPNRKLVLVYHKGEQGGFENRFRKGEEFTAIAIGTPLPVGYLWASVDLRTDAGVAKWQTHLV
jgi:hypothetical protein